MIKTPKIKTGGIKVSSFSELANKKMTKDVQFMGTKVKISKLSVDEVLTIQDLAKAASAVSEESGDDNSGFEILKTVLKFAVEGAEDMTDEEFGKFPMAELSTLSSDIMEFSGVNKGK
jgi:hypothetical protein